MTESKNRYKAPEICRKSRKYDQSLTFYLLFLNLLKCKCFGLYYIEADIVPFNNDVEIRAWGINTNIQN